MANTHHEMRRVVVTGIGLITSLGLDVETSWKNLINSKSGIKKIPPSLFSTENISSKVAGYITTIDEDSINGFDPSKYIDNKHIRSMDRFIMFTVAAAAQAVKDSGIEIKNDEEAYRSGVLIGAGIGGLLCIENNANILLKNDVDGEKGPKRISPFFIPASLINLASGHVAIQYNLKGPNYSIVTACASSAHSIGEAARIITCDEADVMICGGSEAAICRLGVAGFAAARSLSTGYNDTPEKASRPWDKNRDGFVIGEGGGIIVLEEYEKAKKRGAKIYGELVGYGLTGDAYHITAPDPNGDGGFRAMQNACRKAKITPDQIDYINAHGTSTKIGDIIEYNSIKRIFDGYNAKKVAISSTKSSIGHLLGGAGAVEIIFSLLAMRDNVVPPTLNLDNKEEECEMNLVPYTSIQKKVDVILSNSFGFGGTNAAVLFKKI